MTCTPNAARGMNTSGAGIPGWTVVYAAAADRLRNDRVAFRPVRPPTVLSLPTVLAVPTGDARLRDLLDACRETVRNTP